MSEPIEPSRFPLEGRRAVVYATSASNGRVKRTVLVALSGIRPSATRLIVVTGALSEADRARVSTIADEVVQLASDASGLWAHRMFLNGYADSLAEFDEVVFTGDGWFGPVSPLEPVVERMETRYVDAWSLTDRRDSRPHDRREGRNGDLHLSLYWFAVRPRLFSSAAWKEFWVTLPERPAAEWAVREIESSFSRLMTAAGFRLGAAFTSDDYPAEHADTFNVDLLLADGCPAVRRDVFDGYPLFYDQHAIIGRRIAEAMRQRGYPVGDMWSDLARVCAPKRLHTNGSMMEVLPEVERSPILPALRILAVVQVALLEGLGDLLARVTSMPGVNKVICVVDTVPAEEVQRSWQQCTRQSIAFEVRTAHLRDALDVVAIVDECKQDVFADGVDLVLSVHTGAPEHATENAQQYFRRQQWDALLASPAYAANVIDLFRAEQRLGLVFPPTPHIGLSSFGDGWHGTRDTAQRWLRRAGITVPLDWASPHGPVGGMWLGRPDALRMLADTDWPRDHDSAALFRRILSYVAADAGFYTRTVTTAEHAGLSHGSLEYTTDHMSVTSYGYPAGYTELLHRAGPVGTGRGIDFIRMWALYRHPRAWRFASRLGRVVRAGRRMTRRLSATTRKGF